MELLPLSRYLYIIDEVKLSFISCLLNKRSLEECIFWISEYYYSGYENETWLFLIKVYYDFYALKNPGFAKNMQTIYNKYAVGDVVGYVVGDAACDAFATCGKISITAIIYVVYNLFNKQHDNTVFLFRQLDIIDSQMGAGFYVPKKSRGRKPKWLIDYDTTFHDILLSISKNNSRSLLYYLRNIQNDTILKLNTLKQTLLKFFLNFNSLHKGTHIDESNIDLMIENITSLVDDLNIDDLNILDQDISCPQKYKSCELYKHSIITTIVIGSSMASSCATSCATSSCVASSFVASNFKKSIIIKPNKELFDYVYQLNDISQFHLSCMSGDTLKYKLCYPIDKNIGSFNLIRHKWINNGYNIIDEILMNWDYHCSNTPIWKKRIDEHKATTDHQNKKLVFASDDMNEIFYSKYGYFPDEISNEYYDRITGDIPYLYTNFIPEIGSEILYSY